MTLHQKALLTISVTICCLIGLLYGISRVIVLRGFITLEEQEIRQRVAQARSALDDEIAGLMAIVTDWAIWDDSYAFVADRNEAYIASNLTDATFIRQRLNLIMYVNASAQIVFEKFFDLETNMEIPVPGSFHAHVAANAKLLRHADIESHLSGMVRLPEGILLIAACPILTSMQAGPIRGTLLMARYLTETEILQLISTTHLTLSFFRLDDPKLPPEAENMLKSVASSREITSRVRDQQTISGYALVDDIYGVPSLMLRVNASRNIYAQGQASLRYFLFALLMAGISLGAVMVLILDRIVLVRIAQLNHSVRRLNAETRLSKRLAIAGNDEVAALARAMNGMLSAIEQSQTAMLESEERFRRLSESSFEGVIIHDQTTVLDANHVIEDLFGYQHAELIGMPFFDLLAPEARESARAYFETGDESRYESKGRKKDGATLTLEMQSKVMPYQGRMVISSAIRDISWRKMAEEALRQRTREMTLLNHMSDLLQTCENEEETYSIVINVCKLLFSADSGQLIMLNASNALAEVVAFWGAPPLVRSFPTESCEVLRRKQTILFESPSDAAQCPHISDAGRQSCLCGPVSASGELFGMLTLCFASSGAAQSDEDARRTYDTKQIVLTRVQTHYALALSNLRLRETLRQESIRDPLTGLYNRRYMDESLEREAYRAGRHHIPIGLVMLDIDHFKRFNDTYGHEAGDLVLQEVGKFLRQHIRHEDIACRYGGEEFLLILPEANLEAVQHRAEQLRAGIKALELTYEGEMLRVTSSFGVTTLSEHPTIQNAVNAADDALYQAKKAGRDRVMAYHSERRAP